MASKRKTKRRSKGDKSTRKAKKTASSSATPTSSLEKRLERVFVPLFLIVFCSLALWGAVNDGITADELAHLPAGYSYWKTGNFEMNYEHPPLIKLLSGFPLLFADVDDSAFETDAWEQGNDGEWVFGNHIMFKSNTSVDTLLLLGRIPIVLLGVLLGVLIYVFAKELFGIRAGLIALGLYSVHPESLAHAHLVTTDLGVTLGILATIFFWYKYIRTQKRLHHILTGVCMGLSMSAKFTGVYLLGIMGLLFVGERMSRGRPFLDSFLRSIYPMVKLSLIAIFTLIITYKITQFPYFFKGLAFVSEHSTAGHQSFLLGMRSMTGWWWYFPVAFVLKTPISILLGMTLAIIASVRNKNHPLRKSLYILSIPILFYLFAFMVNAINIGVRHILPMTPFILMGIGALVVNKKTFHLLLGLVGIQFILTLMIAPHFLSHFNVAVGANNGHKYLLDSNIDWGQDLKGLHDYLQKNPLEPLYLAYFGNDNATERGISFERAKCYPKKGYWAISVNQLQGIRDRSSRCFKWLREQHTPFHKIGHSIYLYEITQDTNEEQARLSYCENECAARCEDKGLQYKWSTWDQKCKCTCTGNLNR